MTDNRIEAIAAALNLNPAATADAFVDRIKWMGDEIEDGKTMQASISDKLEATQSDLDEHRAVVHELREHGTWLLRYMSGPVTS